jgi:alpha-tubulin suppressor-like RCC1 family protein
MTAIKTDGTLWTWGQNNYGQLGDGTTTSRRSPVTVFGYGTNWCSVASIRNHTLAVKTDGGLWIWGRNNYGQLGDGTTTSRCSPGRIPGENTWCSPSGTYFSSFAIRVDNNICQTV